VNDSGKIMNRTRTKAALYGIVSFDRPWKYVLRSTSSTHVKLDLYRPDRVQNCGKLNQRIPRVQGIIATDRQR
jgi:hypothetical protein